MQSRLRQLDVLRTIALVLVLGRHSPPPGTGVVQPVRLIGQVWYTCGWIGVDIFFVLSGFLVSGLLFTEFKHRGEVQAFRFLARRGFKVYPPFYLFLLASVIYLWPATGAAAWQLLTYVRNEVFFLQNYVQGLYPHTWSLAVEEHFYFMLAAVVVLLARRGTADPFRPFVYLVPLAGAAALAMRTRAAFIYPVDVMTFTVPFPTHLRGDSVGWGVLLGYWYHFRDRQWLRTLRRCAPLVVLVVALLLTPSVVWPVGQSKALLTIGLTSVALGVTLLMALVLPPEDDPPPWRRGRWIARISRDSFSIYLWHIPVSLWVMPYITATGLLTFRNPTLAYAAEQIAFIGTSVAVGMAMAGLVEHPSLALRDRLLPSRSGRQRIAPVPS